MSKDNMLDRLPVELKIKILSYTRTYDLFILSKILSAFEFCMFEKLLMSKIEFYKDYRLCKNDLAVICKNPRNEIITHLNINCVYWIPAAEIRKCIIGLQALEFFFAVDTKFKLSSVDCYCLSSLLHLKRIALSFHGKLGTEVIDTFPRQITHLYLHLSSGSNEDISRISYLIHKLQNLEELWVIDFTTLTSMRILSLLPKTLKKLTIFVRSTPNIAIIQNFYLSNSFVSFRSRRRGLEISFANKSGSSINNIYNEWRFENDVWDRLINHLKMDIPLCSKDSNLLIRRQKDLSNIDFSEINVFHSSVQCSQLLKTTLNLMFLGSNMLRLKKLSANICLSGVQVESSKSSSPEILFKKMKRVSRFVPERITSSHSTLSTIVNSCPFLQELELWECESCYTSPENSINDSLTDLKNFKYLRKLTLDGLPVHVSGQFLIEIFKTCNLLESFRIRTQKNNNLLINYICQALPYAQSLKDFRCEQKYIPIDRLIDSLCSINKSKLERLVIKCNSGEVFSSASLKTLLQSCKRMRFLCMVIKEIPKIAIRNINDVLKTFKTSPEKVYLVTQDDEEIIRRMCVPDTHICEMLRCNSEICTLDIFNGFTR